MLRSLLTTLQINHLIIHLERHALVFEQLSEDLLERSVFHVDGFHAHISKFILIEELEFRLCLDFLYNHTQRGVRSIQSDLCERTLHGGHGKHESHETTRHPFTPLILVVHKKLFSYF